MAVAGLGRPLRRIGLQDTFAEGARSADYLFSRYGLSAQSVVAAAWQGLGRPGPAPEVQRPAADPGEYSPV
jgi:transketolase